MEIINWTERVKNGEVLHRVKGEIAQNKIKEA
jgi:hypothetical protein